MDVADEPEVFSARHLVEKNKTNIDNSSNQSIKEKPATTMAFRLTASRTSELESNSNSVSSAAAVNDLSNRMEHMEVTFNIQILCRSKLIQGIIFLFSLFLI